MPNIICPRHWLLIKYFTIAIQSKVAIRGRPSLAPVAGSCGRVRGRIRDRTPSPIRGRIPDGGFADGFWMAEPESDFRRRNQSRALDGGIGVGL